MKAYKYIDGHGHTAWATGAFNWRSLCHNEDVMDDHTMYIEDKDLGWGICKRCGSLASFIVRRK